MIENAQVTFDLGWLITAVFIPVIWLLVRRINSVSDDLSTHKVESSKTLNDYMLAAERQFASVGHLQDVEKRLVDEIKGLRDDIKDLTRAMNQLARKGV